MNVFAAKIHQTEYADYFPYLNEGRPMIESTITRLLSSHSSPMENNNRRKVFHVVLKTSLKKCTNFRESPANKHSKQTKIHLCQMKNEFGD